MSCLERQDSPVRHRVDLPRNHDVAAVARRFLDAHFRASLGDVAYVNARLIVSELVTNAFVHGTGDIVLDLEQDGAVLRIEVVDEGTGEAPAIREQPESGVGGWGLRIVDTVAMRWGAFAGSTHVWAEIALD